MSKQDVKAFYEELSRGSKETTHLNNKYSGKHKQQIRTCTNEYRRGFSISEDS
jgi:hypothetical protein